jgi:hypothetical protein
MKHVELHAHYLRQLVLENIVSLLYCKTNDQGDEIFTKPLSKARFIKIHIVLGIKEFLIVGGVPTNVISPTEYIESCVDGAVLEYQVMMVHHTSPVISWSCSQPKFGNIQSGDQTNLNIS